MSLYPANYLEYLKLFNQEKFFEAHEVLEKEWHKVRQQNNFYKGLIQLAAALVHIQKRNGRGARELFRTSSRYLSAYLPKHQGLDLEWLLKEVRIIDSDLNQEDDLVWERIRYPTLKLNP